MDRTAASQQDRFAAALLDPERPIPDGLVTPDGRPASRRFGIYRNNVTVGLVNALAEVFPTTQNLVGEEFFRAMARQYLLDHPPASRLLFEYGATFPDFLSGFEPAAELPFLADVARLERLWLDCFHAADAAPLDGAVLQRVAPQDLAELRLIAHPAARLFRARHAAVTIMTRDRTGAPLDGLDPFRAEDGLVTRPAFDPEIRHLPPAGADFVGLLLDGGTLGEAAAAAFAADPDFDLPAAISAIVEAGAFCKAVLRGMEAS
jgi:hypothetical protein